MVTFTTSVNCTATSKVSPMANVLSDPAEVVTLIEPLPPDNAGRRASTLWVASWATWANSRFASNVVPVERMLTPWLTLSVFA